jgi:hypothetical protein
MSETISLASYHSAIGQGMQFAESREQAAFIQWCRYLHTEHGLLNRFVIAIPNGSHLAGLAKQRAVHMARLKAEGLKPGTSDLFIAYPVDPYSGLWLEFKRRRSQFVSREAAKCAVSEDQRAFLVQMGLVGYATAVAYGCDEAIDIVKGYLQGRYER